MRHLYLLAQKLLPIWRMKNYILLILFMAMSAAAFAQNDVCRPARTPEEEAQKQTQMLQRELSLTDAQCDTVYKIHLKYATMRQISNTRAESLERMNAMTAELLNVLTKAQRDAFLNKQVSPDPRRLQMRMNNKMCVDSVEHRALLGQ